MEPVWFVVVALAAFALVVAPILAVGAWVRVRRLEKGGAPQPPGGFDPQVVARLYAIEQRFKQLEQRVALLARREIFGAAAEPPRPAPIPSEPAAPGPTAPPAFQPEGAIPSAAQGVSVPARPPGATTPARGLDLESVIAGRWLNRVGILALLLAVAFFIRYAFENDWVGPRGRVAIGLLLGAALLPWSHWLLQRGYRYFSEGIAGLGAAVLYVSLWGGWHYYQLFPRGAALAGMIAVTAAMVAIAVGRDSQRVALLALSGGVATPLLLSTGRDAQVALFSYLAVLAASLLAVAHRRRWNALGPVLFAATQFYFWAWYGRFFAAERNLERTVFFATLLFAIFAAVPVVRVLLARRHSSGPSGPDSRAQKAGSLAAVETCVVLLNAFAYLIALRVTLWEAHRWTLTLFVLALAAAHAGIASAARRHGVPAGTKGLAPMESGRAPVRLLYAGLSLLFVTLAIPIRLEGKWITMAFAIEGAILFWSGLRAGSWYLRTAAYVLFGVAAVRLAMLPVPAERLLLNARFGVFAVVASYAAAILCARRPAQWGVTTGNLGESEEGVLDVLGVAANVFVLWALSLEAWAYFGYGYGPHIAGRTLEGSSVSPGLARQLALSVLWTAYAVGLLATGARRKLAALRWQALVLFLVVVGKVFLFDLSFLERFYRILSFLVLGLVLLVVSFYYQHKLAAEKKS